MLCKYSKLGLSIAEDRKEKERQSINFRLLVKHWLKKKSEMANILSMETWAYSIERNFAFRLILHFCKGQMKLGLDKDKLDLSWFVNFLFSWPKRWMIIIIICNISIITNLRIKHLTINSKDTLMPT